MPFDLNSERELDMARLLPHVEELSRLFDNVQVFVSRHDSTMHNTVSAHAGAGNWHARRGQIREWMLQQDQIAWHEAFDDYEEEE